MKPTRPLPGMRASRFKAPGRWLHTSGVTGSHQPPKPAGARIVMAPAVDPPLLSAADMLHTSCSILINLPCQGLPTLGRMVW
jgi:hypothetical protein